MMSATTSPASKGEAVVDHDHGSVHDDVVNDIGDAD